MLMPDIQITMDIHSPRCSEYILNSYKCIILQVIIQVILGNQRLHSTELMKCCLYAVHQIFYW